MFYVLVGGVALYQGAFVLCLLALQLLAGTPEMSKFVFFFATSQLLGAIAPLQLQNEFIKTASDAEAEIEAISLLAFLVFAFSLACLIIYALGWELISAIQFALGSMAFAWSDVLRAYFIRSGRTILQSAPHFILALSFLASFVAFWVTRDMDMFIWTFCGVALLGHAMLSSYRAMPSYAVFRSLLKKGWRFVVYRTPTTGIDVLIIRSLVLFMGPLGDVFVNTYFLLSRVLIGPAQMAIWAASYVIYKKSLQSEKEEIIALAQKIWRRWCVASIPVIWVFGTVLIVFEANLRLLLDITTEANLVLISLTLFLIVVSQGYIGWLGRIFDSYNLQRDVVIYEVCFKLAILLGVFLISRASDSFAFLIFYGTAYILFTVGFFYIFARSLQIPSSAAVMRYYLLGSIGAGFGGFWLLYSGILGLLGATF